MFAPTRRPLVTFVALVSALSLSLTLVSASTLPDTAEAKKKRQKKRKLPRVPQKFIGVVADDALWGTHADPSGAKTMRAIKKAGVGTIRVPFLWERFEPVRGAWNPELYDNFVERAARRGLTVLPVLFGPPAHRSSAPRSGAVRGTYPPAVYSEFAAFAARVVARYGSHGGFWRSHPSVPYRPVSAWQVWNEPNLRQYWPTGPDPREYTALLKVTSDAIRATDPKAEVVTAGLNESAQGIPLPRFLRAMYRAGARGSFDSLGIHPYAPTRRKVIAQMKRAVRVMKRARDRRARLRVTEVGWATGGPGRHRLIVGKRAQARLAVSTLKQMLRKRRSLRLAGVTFYNWRDAHPYNGGSDHWGLHAGLHTQDGRPKPILAALSSLLGRVVRR